VSKEFAEEVLARAMPSVKATYWTARAASHEALLNRVRSSMAAPPAPPCAEIGSANTTEGIEGFVK
jgi:hypothetical protein